MSRAALAALLISLLALSACATFRAGQLYDRGTEALDRGEVTRAVQDLEEAAALAPEVSQVQNHLGLAYAAAGREEAARAAFERAVALDCENAAAQENLAAAASRATPVSREVPAP